jgi:Zn-finger protein
MAADTIPPIATCPPHHWLIERDDMGRDRWACQKCGLVRADAVRQAKTRRLSNVCTWSRDEVALLDADPE